MSYSLKKIIFSSLSGLTFISHLHAAPSTWNGSMNNNLTDPGNWTAGVPSSDQATFPAVVTSNTPILNPTESLNFSEALFTGGSGGYDFTVVSSGAGTANLSFGSSPSSGIGVNNTTSPAQNITFTAHGTAIPGNSIAFNGTASADAANSGTVSYQIGDATGSGVLIFNDSSSAGGTSLAPGVQITAGDYTGASGNFGVVNFNNGSTAGYSNILVGNTSINSLVAFISTSSTVFSTADHSTITVGDFNNTFSGSTGITSFNGFATADQSTINVGDINGNSSLSFNDSSTAGGTAITPGSQITIGDFTGNSGTSGFLDFEDSATAGYSTIQIGDTNGNSNAAFNSNSSTVFSTADHATITVGDFNDAFFGSSGLLNFNGFSTADQSTINVGDINGNSSLSFNDSSTAGGTAITPGSQITIGDFTGSSGTSATLNFNNSSIAGYSTIRIGDTSGFSVANFNSDSSTVFSTADHATITVGDFTNAFSGSAGFLNFNGFSTAANSKINVGDTGNLSGLDFNNSSTAGSAIVNIGNTLNSVRGIARFFDTSSAGNSQLTLDNNMSRIFFLDNSTAANASITVKNTSELDFRDTSTAGAAQIAASNGGVVFFSQSSSAGSATLTADNNSIVAFAINATGGTSTVALTNTSRLLLGAPSMVAPVTSLTISSLTTDASSSVNLYTGNLTVNYNGVAPITVAGVINDLGNGATSLGGSFTKSGTGTLVLSGANTYSGLTTANQGNLVLNGSVFGDVLVNLGAILSGTGTIGGNATVNGGIAPGNSIGTLNVVGNYTQNVGSTYFLEINGLGQSDLINVTGAATLNGGQVVVTSLDGGALGNTPYTILTAAGGVNGQFAGVTTTNLLVTPTLVYDANHAYLVFAQTVFHFDAVTPNQIAVATQLESITDPTAEEFLILSTLAALPAEAQQRALDEMSGVQYASLNLAAEIAGRQFIRRLYDPLRSIVTTEPCYDPCSCEVPCPTLDVWFEAGGGQTFLDGNANARGLKLNSWEVTAGVQSTFNRDWTVGIAGTYIEDQIKYDIGGTGKNRMGFGAFYGLYRPSNFYVLADAAFGGGEFTVNRNIDIGVLAYSAKGRPKHFQAIGYIEGGFDWNTCNFLIQPFLGFEGGYFRRNTFSETGTSPLNLNINKQAYGQFFSRLGVHMTTEQWSSLKLSVDVAWDCRLSSLKHNVTEQFQSFGNSFVISGVPGNRNSIDAAATISTKLCGGWELYAEVGGEFWSKVSTYNVLGGVKYSW